jgi:cell division protein FtsI/penicillin-binding protein 2
MRARRRGSPGARPVRGPVTAAVAAAVTAVVTAGLLSSCTGALGEDPEDLATDAAVRFLDRWSAGEAARAARATDAPANARELLADVDARLQIGATTYQPEGETTCEGRRCLVPVRLTHTLEGLGSWSYGTTVPVARVDQSDAGPTYSVAWSPRVVHPRLTPPATLSRERVLPPRASIVDRDGTPLTRNGAVSRVGVVAGEVEPRTYGELRSVLGIDPAGLRDSVDAAEPDWFVPVITLRQSDYRPVADELLSVPGVVVDEDVWSLTPTSTWGRALLGSVGPATAETLRAAGPMASPTDVVGVSGLQLAFQQRLAGRPGGRVLLVDEESEATLATLQRFRARPGEDLRTTLDRGVQDAAERAVQSQSKVSALVAVDSGSGDILASAVGPGIQSYNTAFVGQYPPGSTFKVVSTAALLERGAVRLDEPARCPATTTVQGKSFKNYDDFEPLPPGGTFADAFAASCNTAIVSRADGLGDDALHETAEQLGVGGDWDLGVDAFSGSVPVNTGLVDRAASMIGQGRVLMSPLAMAVVAAAVESGRPTTPTLVPGAAGTAPAAGSSMEPLPASLAGSLRSLMRRVVTEGTATEVDLAGMPVFAKTGTAELDSDDPSKTHAWMIGFRDGIAFAVVVENGASGSEDAAPVVREFLEALRAQKP